MTCETGHSRSSNRSLGSSCRVLLLYPLRRFSSLFDRGQWSNLQQNQLSDYAHYFSPFVAGLLQTRGTNSQSPPFLSNIFTISSTGIMYGASLALHFCKYKQNNEGVCDRVRALLHSWKWTILIRMELTSHLMGISFERLNAITRVESPSMFPCVFIKRMANCPISGGSSPSSTVRISMFLLSLL